MIHGFSIHTVHFYPRLMKIQSLSDASLSTGEKDIRRKHVAVGNCCLIFHESEAYLPSTPTLKQHCKVNALDAVMTIPASMPLSLIEMKPKDDGAG